MKHDAETLRWYIEHAEPHPVLGTFDVFDLNDEIVELYEQGVQRGVDTGWIKCKSALLRAAWRIDGCVRNRIERKIELARLSTGKHRQKIRLAFCNFLAGVPSATQYMAAMCEKYIRKPFNDGPSARMSRAELNDAMNWTREHFTWILPKSEDDWRIDNILDIGAKLCLRNGIRGLVVDPGNELENSRPPGITETEYIGQSLKRARFFAREKQIHVWIVAHPTKMQRSSDGNFPIPTLWDISSMHIGATRPTTEL